MRVPLAQSLEIRLFLRAGDGILDACRGNMLHPTQDRVEKPRPYLLGESEAETRRLRTQASQIPTISRVVWGGLGTSMQVVDAGCGPGEISRAMARVVGPQGSVHAFDLSEVRLSAARAGLPEPDSAPIHYLKGDVYHPPIAAGSADFVFSQFVFEYLSSPLVALEALIGLLKPGGILCLSDIDGIGETNWPVPTEVAAGVPRLLRAMEGAGFDAHVGRKLYSWMVDAGLRDVSVRMDPHVTAGKASPDEVANWTQRFEALAPLGEPAFGGAAPYRRFTEAYLAMLAEPRSLKFMEVFTVCGTRAG